MKIKITENMIKGPYGKIDKLFKTPDGFITNGDWMIREEYVELPDSHPALEDLKKTISFVICMVLIAMLQKKILFHLLKN